MKRLLFVVLILKQLLWTSFIPLWHFPDEQAHFAQIQNLVEKKGKTISPDASTSREIFESEFLLGTLRDGQGNNLYTHRSFYNMPYESGTEGRYENEIKAFPQEYRHDRIIVESTGYPPLYYIASSLVYRVFYNENFISRVFMVRLVNLLIYLATIIVVFEIASLLFTKQPVLANTLAIAVAFHPMFSFVSAGINSDNLFNLLFTIAIYISLYMLRNGLQVMTIFVSILTVILAVYTKPHGLLVPLVFLFPLAFQLRKTPKSKSGWIVGVLMLFLGLGVVVRNLLSQQQFLPEIPALKYLPKLTIESYLTHLKNSLIHAYREVLPWYWGVFRWLSLTYPRWVHRSINVLVLLSSIGVLSYAFRSLNKALVKIISLPNLFFCIYASAIYFLALTTFNYFFINSHGFYFGIQGRYFLATVVPHIVLMVVGLYSLTPTQFKNRAMYLLSFAFICLHTYALAFVISSYYSTASWSVFFNQASQYKPQLFKSPFLEILSIMFFFSLIFFIYFSARKFLSNYGKN